MLAEGIDVAIRIGQLADSSLTARRIGVSRRVLVAVPGLAARVSAPEDIQTLPAITYRLAAADVRASFEHGSRKYDLRMASRIGVNSMSAVREMVLDGRGVHLGPEWAYADDLAAERLVHVLPDASFNAFQIHAIWLPTPFQPAAPRSFIAKMSEALRKARMA